MVDLVEGRFQIRIYYVHLYSLLHYVDVCTSKTHKIHCNRSPGNKSMLFSRYIIFRLIQDNITQDSLE